MKCQRFPVLGRAFRHRFLESVPEFSPRFQSQISSLERGASVQEFPPQLAIALDGKDVTVNTLQQWAINHMRVECPAAHLDCQSAEKLESSRVQIKECQICPMRTASNITDLTVYLCRLLLAGHLSYWHSWILKGLLLHFSSSINKRGCSVRPTGQKLQNEESICADMK